MIDLKQKELKKWQMRNFGEASKDDMVFGMVEELGELCHEMLKKKQGIREYDPSKFKCKEDIDKLFKHRVGDAFSDGLIYGIQLMTMLGVDVEEIIKETIEEVLNRDFVNNPSGI